MYTEKQGVQLLVGGGPPEVKTLKARDEIEIFRWFPCHWGFNPRVALLRISPPTYEYARIIQYTERVKAGAGLSCGPRSAVPPPSDYGGSPGHPASNKKIGGRLYQGARSHVKPPCQGFALRLSPKG